MVVPVFAPIGEEPGWRGFALPRMQSGRTPFVATLVLGVVVAAWHVPLIWISEENFEPVMLVGTIAVTFFYTWLFNHTRGSVFMTMVAHAADGLVGAKLLADGGFHGAGATRFSVLYTTGWCLVAVVLVVLDRRMWFAPMHTPALVDGESRRTGSGRVAVTVTAVVLLLAVPLVGVAGARVASAPSRDTYVERADAICQRTTDKTDAVVEDLGFTPSDDEARAAAVKLVALARTELRQLRALAMPSGDARELSRIYLTMERAWDRVERAPHVLTEEPSPLAKATRFADAYGFEVCGRG